MMRSFGPWSVIDRTWAAVSSVAILLAVLTTVRSVPAQPPDTGHTVSSTSQAGIQKAKPVRAGHLYARGSVYRDDKLFGMWIVRIDPKTGAWTKLLDEGDDVTLMRISPDGQTIAYRFKREIWTADTQTAANPGKISGDDGMPLWSPDGKSIIVSHGEQVKGGKTRRPSWTHKTWKFTETGTNREPLDLPKDFGAGDWSPDGKWLVSFGEKGLRMISPDGKKKRRLSKALGHHPRFSPDGKQILFTRGYYGELKVSDLVGKKVRTFFRAGNLVSTAGAVWSRNSKQIATLLVDRHREVDGTITLTADPAVSHPRIAIVDVKTGKHRILKLPVVNGVRFEPCNVRDWR